MVDLLLSIKPEFAEKILSGNKHFEFRKQIPRRHIQSVYIYSSYPEKMIVGKFRIRSVLKGTPEELWEKCEEGGGIEKDRFFSYFKDKSIGYGFQVVDVKRFDSPVNPRKTNKDFKAPQSFAYLSDISDIGINKNHLDSPY